MLSTADVITANEERVAAKVMEGEAILINLMTGAYYRFHFRALLVMPAFRSREASP